LKIILIIDNEMIMGLYIVTEKTESLNCFSRLLLVYEALGCATAVILKIFFYKLAEILALENKLLSKYFVSFPVRIIPQIRHNNSFIHHRSSVNLTVKEAV
jgi:hypothetical protein